MSSERAISFAGALRAIAALTLAIAYKELLLTVWLPSYFLFGSYFILCCAIILSRANFCLCDNSRECSMENTAGNGEEARQTEIRQEDDQCGHTDRTRGLGKPESGSSQSGNDSHGTDNPNLQSQESRRFTGVSRGEISGGMLSQLILETQEELAYLEQKIPRLRARLNSFQQLYGDLQRKTREDLNDADEEDEVGDSVKRSYSDEGASALLLSADRIDDASNEEE
jgi:hypothetical protein